MGHDPSAMSAVVVWEDMGTDGRVGKGCRVQLLGSHRLPALGRCCSEPWSHKGTEHVVPATRHAAAARGEEAAMTRQCGDFALGTDSSERSSVRPSHGISALCWELHQVTREAVLLTPGCALCNSCHGCWGKGGSCSPVFRSSHSMGTFLKLICFRGPGVHPCLPPTFHNCLSPAIR